MDNLGKIQTLETPSGSRSWEPYQIYMVCMMAVIYAWNYIDRVIISVVAHQVKMDLQLSDFQVGIMGGFAFAVFYAVVSIPLARLAERRNRLRIINLSLTVWSLFTALGGLAQNYGQLLVSRIGVGAGEAGFVAPGQSMICDEFTPRQRTMALSCFSLGPPIGIFAGGMVGGYLAQEYGWRWALIIAGTSGLLIAVIAQLTLREPLRGTLDIAAKRDLDGSSLVGVARHIWRTPTLLLLLLTGVCTNFGGFGAFNFLPSFLIRKYGLSTGEAGLATGILVGASGCVGVLLGGLLSQAIADRWPRRLLLFPAVAFAVSAPFYVLGYSQSSAFLAIALLMVPEMLRYTWLGPGFATIHNLTSPRDRATVTALIYMFMSFIGMGLGPVAAGALSDLMAAWHYVGDNFHWDCVAGAAPTEACSSASVEGIRLAMIAVSLVSAAGAIPLFIATRLSARHSQA